MIKTKHLDRVIRGMDMATARISDPTRIAVRSAEISRLNAEALREQTLISGAMPGEFEVVHVYRRGCGFNGMPARLR